MKEKCVKVKWFIYCLLFDVCQEQSLIEIVMRIMLIQSAHPINYEWYPITLVCHQTNKKKEAKNSHRVLKENIFYMRASWYNRKIKIPDKEEHRDGCMQWCGNVKSTQIWTWSTFALSVKQATRKAKIPKKKS